MIPRELYSSGTKIDPTFTQQRCGSSDTIQVFSFAGKCVDEDRGSLELLALCKIIRRFYDGFLTEATQALKTAKKNNDGTIIHVREKAEDSANFNQTLAFRLTYV